MQKTLHKFTTCLWFDNNAEEAMKFYASVFANSRLGPTTHYGKAGHEIHQRPKGSVMTATCTIDGHELIGVNGGPLFTLNPSISLYISCRSAGEVETLYKRLSQGGSVLMELDKYPFSQKYAWINDKFGVSWQLILTDKTEQKVAPCLMFTGEHSGQAEEAINFYTSIFKNSKVDYLVRYEQNEPTPGTVKHAGFKLDGQQFVAMDSPIDHAFTFTPATSLMIKCKTQAEVDEMWSKLQAGGGEPSQCGWLVDKFGVSWQVVPSVLEELLASKDNDKRERVLAALMEMTKLDIAELEAAFKG